MRCNHRSDWGDLCNDNKTANEDALEHHTNPLSSYKIGD